MLFLTLFMLTVTAICVFLIWPGLDASSAKPSKRTQPGGAAESRGALPARPESLEGVLVAKLMAGEINHGQYLRAVEGIAARDEERHPLAVPPDIGPADA